jgi:hypothetical protein
MAWGTDVEVPLNVEPVQSPPTVAAKGPTSASVPRTRRILPNQAEVAAQLPRREPPGFTPLGWHLVFGAAAPLRPVRYLASSSSPTMATANCIIQQTHISRP